MINIITFFFFNEVDLREFELVYGTFIAQMKLMKKFSSRHDWRCDENKMIK